MAITPYATVGDLELFLDGVPPTDAVRLLARAQDLVDDALTASAYAVDTNGNATDATVIAGLKKAVCAQVEWWVASGDELGQSEQFSSYSIEGISVTRAAERANLQQELCDRSKAALRFAGLLPGTVIIS